MMHPIEMNELIDKIFNLSRAIRYVSVYSSSNLFSRQRSDIEHSSSSESDRYEELLVNPAILKIAEQRGNIDCGGLEFIIIKYGNFYQLIRNYRKGHISVCVEKDKDPIEISRELNKLLEYPDTPTAETGQAL